MKAQILWIGAILTPGKRVVTEALRVMGLGDSQPCAQYHQVLNRAAWSPLAMAPIVLKLLVRRFAQAGEPLVFGIDPTIERRWGAKIAARGIYRDALRSSDSHFVKTSGLRWISLMLLTTIPRAQRVWALPVITVLSPSERYDQQRQRHPKTLLERSLQMVKALRRWLPDKALVIVGDNTYAALDFLVALLLLLPWLWGMADTRQRVKATGILAGVLMIPTAIWMLLMPDIGWMLWQGWLDGVKQNSGVYVGDSPSLWAAGLPMLALAALIGWLILSGSLQVSRPLLALGLPAMRYYSSIGLLERCRSGAWDSAIYRRC